MLARTTDRGARRTAASGVDPVASSVGAWGGVRDSLLVTASFVAALLPNCPPAVIPTEKPVFLRTEYTACTTPLTHAAALQKTLASTDASAVLEFCCASTVLTALL
jgi:hypothetical protein